MDTKNITKTGKTFIKLIFKDFFKKNLEIDVLLVLFQKNEKEFLQKIKRKLTLVPFVTT